MKGQIQRNQLRRDDAELDLYRIADLVLDGLVVLPPAARAAMVEVVCCDRTPSDFDVCALFVARRGRRTK